MTKIDIESSVLNVRSTESTRILTHQLRQIFTWFDLLLQGEKIEFSKRDINEYKHFAYKMYHIVTYTVPSNAIDNYDFEKKLQYTINRLVFLARKELKSKQAVFSNQIVLDFKSKLNSILMEEEFQYSLETELLPKFHYVYKLKLSTLTTEQLNKILPEEFDKKDVRALMAGWKKHAYRKVRGTLFSKYAGLYFEVMREFRVSNNLVKLEFPDNQPSNTILSNMLIDNYPQFRSNYINRLVELINSGTLFIHKRTGSKPCTTLI